jgi:hypothetical protein
MAKKRAFARYTKKGQIVPGSLVVTTQGGYPDKTSLWKEVPVSLLDETSYGDFKLVTGGVAGDGVVLNNYTNSFTFIGPNDGAGPGDNSTGWVYLKRKFPAGARLTINYNWTSFDEGVNVDRPVYWTSPTEPTGQPGDTTPRVEDTPVNGTWTITVPPGEWFGIGIYSSDSCCGRGFFDIEISNIETSVYVEYQIPSDPFSFTNPFVRINCGGTQVVYQYITGGGPYTTIPSLVNAFNNYEGTASLGEYLNAGSNSVGLRLTMDAVYNICGEGVITLEIGED